METTITRQSRVSMGIFVAIVLAAVSGTYQWSAIKSDNALRFQAIELKIEHLEKSVRETMDDRWRRHDMQAWVNQLKELNPSLKIPILNGQ